jgi:RNA polymerase sigma-70 factor (ECF subfamily)
MGTPAVKGTLHFRNPWSVLVLKGIVLEMDNKSSFPSTRWSLLEQAKADSPDGRRALAAILDRYLPALAAFIIRSRRIPADKADDLLQAFVTEKLLESSLLSNAHPDRGRFRNLLLQSLRNFIVSHARHENARVRDTRREVSFEFADATSDGEPDPAQIYEMEWARAVISEATTRMKANCAAGGREDIWNVFEGRLLTMCTNEDPTPYSELMEQNGIRSPLHASNLLATGKRMYARILRQVVSEYEKDPERVDAEIAELRATLSRSSGQEHPG